jgi:hypothetical protein
VLDILADLDNDGDVDADDLDIIGNNAGMTGADWEDGDLDNDNEVTGDDVLIADILFEIWGLDGFDFNVVS